ncbi:MAG: serine/threonine protein kinase, partial [Acidobacteria bacterium]|nr:serine/threonine protein kinase [Acidobacteriota bacterium]
MSLSAGTRLGPYEVTAQIGVGGMGEVYRATDTNLKRAVAIKVLPESVAGDGDRLTRLQREAEVLASLNHPNIAAIYGLERSEGTTALVMELVEGPTLAERIAQLSDVGRVPPSRSDGTRGGPAGLPIDEALPIAKQIADALEAAHERGIIHRDLKPANIKLRPDGVVKVLDFGLAKALDEVGRGSVSARPGPADGLTNSPTLSFAATQAGMILGTAGYMSPEQAKGRAVDKRSDVWAFGAVLYEMLTGRRPFEGEDVADTLAAVLMKEPDWAALPATTPPRVVAVLRRCLQKDRKQRARDIGDVALAIEGAFEGGVPQIAGAAGDGPAEAGHYVRGKGRSLRRRVALVGAAAACATGVIAGAAVWWTMRPAPPSVARTTITTSGATALTVINADRDVAITPDGSRIVYRGANQLLVRAIDRLEPDVLGGLGAPRGVFVSPDGQWIGFFDGASLKKVAITGGPPV